MRPLRDAGEWIWGPDTRTADRVARRLASLGHLEIDWPRGRWAVSPPTVATLPRSGALAVLVGARTSALLDRLEDLPASLDVDVACWPHDATRDHVPQIFLQAASLQELELLATHLGAEYRFRAADGLAPRLPDVVAHLLTAPESVGEPESELSVFDARAVCWQPAPHDHENGFYRYRSRLRETQFRLRHRSQRLLRIDRDMGFFCEFSRQGQEVLAHVEGGVCGRLVLRAGPLVDLHLPDLHERCALLCSGLEPDLGEARGLGAVRVYHNVPETLAERLAETLAQPLLRLPSDDLQEVRLD
jgi:hypothetical protein